MRQRGASRLRTSHGTSALRIRMHMRTVACSIRFGSPLQAAVGFPTRGVAMVLAAAVQQHHVAVRDAPVVGRRRVAVVQHGGVGARRGDAGVALGGGVEVRGWVTGAGMSGGKRSAWRPRHVARLASIRQASRRGAARRGAAGRSGARSGAAGRGARTLVAAAALGVGDVPEQGLQLVLVLARLALLPRANRRCGPNRMGCDARRAEKKGGCRHAAAECEPCWTSSHAPPL